MPSIDEGLLLDTLDLNSSAGPFTIEDLVFKPAEKKPLWADNADSDGQLLVDEARYTNAFFEGMRIRVEPQESMDDALDLLAELTDKLQKAERMAPAGGIPVPWTPAGSTKTWTWYAILGEYLEVPTTVTGELAGWFVNSPIVTVKLTCRPFGHGEKKRVLAPVTSIAPLQTAILDDPGGDVPAEAEIIVTDKAGQDRRHAEVGLEQLEDAESPPANLIDSDSLVVTGFAGAQATREGAYDPNASGNNVVRFSAVSSPVVVCSTGPIANIGSFRLKPRIYASSLNLRVRASYRVGDGPFQALEWKQPVLAGVFTELDIGEATLERLAKGEQKSEVRIEVKSVGSKVEGDLDYLNLLPTTKGYGKARGLPSNDLTALIAYDEFGQETGNVTGGYTANDISAVTAANPGVITCSSHGLSNGDTVWIEGIVGSMGEALRGLFTVAGVTTNTFNVGVDTTGKTYTSGGKVSKAGKTVEFPATAEYFGVGDADDGSINASAHTLQRIAVSDANSKSGRFFIVGDAAAVSSLRIGVNVEQTASKATLLAIAESGSDEARWRWGVFARYRDVSNWLMAVLTCSAGGSDYARVGLYKCVAGVITASLGSDEEAEAGAISAGSAVAEALTGDNQARIELQAGADGVCSVWAYAGDGSDEGPELGSGVVLASVQDDDLKSGGALASGWYGIYDAWPQVAANTRTYDKLNVLAAAEARRVCHANQSAELGSSDDWLREDADGGDWGAVFYRGHTFLLPPAGDTAAVNRLAVKMRRNDTDTEADGNIADQQELEVWATPRVLIPR